MKKYGFVFNLITDEKQVKKKFSNLFLHLNQFKKFYNLSRSQISRDWYFLAL